MFKPDGTLPDTPDARRVTSAHDAAVVADNSTTSPAQPHDRVTSSPRAQVVEHRDPVLSVLHLDPSFRTGRPGSHSVHDHRRVLQRGRDIRAPIHNGSSRLGSTLRSPSQSTVGPPSTMVSPCG